MFSCNSSKGSSKVLRYGNQGSYVIVDLLKPIEIRLMAINSNYDVIMNLNYH